MTNTSGKKKFLDPLTRAVFIAPLAVIPALLIYSIYAAFIEVRFPYYYDGPRLDVVGMVFRDNVVGILGIAYLLTIIFGYPLIVILRVKNMLNLATVLMVGLLGTYIVTFIYYINPWVSGRPPSVSDLLLPGSFTTAICVVFWLVYRQGSRS